MPTIYGQVEYAIHFSKSISGAISAPPFFFQRSRLPTDYYSVKLSFGLKLCIFLAAFKIEAHFVVIASY
jgi:hypothetical protein